MPKTSKKKAKLNRAPGIHLHKTKLRKNGKREYFWVLISKNGRTLATSETYVFKQGATKAIKSVFHYMEEITAAKKPLGTNYGLYYDHTEKGYELAANLVVL